MERKNNKFLAAPTLEKRAKKEREKLVKNLSLIQTAQQQGSFAKKFMTRNFIELQLESFMRLSIYEGFALWHPIPI